MNMSEYIGAWADEQLRNLVLAVAIIVGLILGFWALLAVLTAAGVESGASPIPQGIPGYTVILDPATGCQYLRSAWDTDAPLSPRTGADGKQICGQLDLERTP